MLYFVLELMTFCSFYGECPFHISIWGVIIYTYLSMEVNYGNKFDSMNKIKKQRILNAD